MVEKEKGKLFSANFVHNSKGRLLHEVDLFLSQKRRLHCSQYSINGISGVGGQPVQYNTTLYWVQ